MTQDKILILDFGSQVTQLIARRVREAHVYCELHSFDMPLDEIKAFNPKGIILSGGPNSVYESDYQADTGIFDLGIPVLGICYGMQFMAHHLGGEVQPGNQREFGYAQVKTIDSELTRDIYDDAPNTLDVWMSHGDKVSKLPNGFAVIGDTPSCPNCHDGKRRKTILRHPIPSRSDPHQTRPRPVEPLCLGYLRCATELDDAELHRRSRCQNP